MSDILVEIHQLSKSFPNETKPALDYIEATIPKGEIVGLVGPDGAGKTTLIRLIAGLLLPSKGTITVDGYSTISDAPSIHHFLGYMPQKFGLYEDLTVMQNLNLYADLKGVGKNRAETFDRLLQFTSLAPFKDRLAGALSGGMKQKLGLACTLVQKPTLLLLDEPSVGVDPLSRRELWKMVQELLKEEITVVWSTSYLDEAERCDTIILLNEGKMLYHGSPTELTKKVEGRTFLLSNIVSSRRTMLATILKQPEVVDGIIQGQDIRVVVKDKLFDLNRIEAGSAMCSKDTPPRFEDAFMDILGGGPGGDSPLAEKTPPIQANGQIVIEAQDLTKKFNNFTAAQHISFKIQKGEIFGLLGPNGAGKSTTFKMMCGLLKPTSGKAFVNGLDLQVAPGEARSHIGYMAQKFSLYGDLSVVQNLEFFSGIYNLVGKKQQEMIDEMIEIFNLKPFLNTSAALLPLGFKQRLALSCAVMHRPEVLFLDEPTSGVDPITRREFWNHINGLVEKGVTVMVTTHFMDEAEYCDRIALVYQSKIITVGSPEFLKEQGKSLENPTPSMEDAFIKLIENYGMESK